MVLANQKKKKKKTEAAKRRGRIMGVKRKRGKW
jgi:hypothetical protein